MKEGAMPRGRKLESLELTEDGTEFFFEAAPREVVTVLVWP